jgi:hypothetical protein
MGSQEQLTRSHQRSRCSRSSCIALVIAGGLALVAADSVQASPADRGARTMPFVPALGFFHDVVDGSDGAIWVSASLGIGRVTPSLELNAFRKPLEYRLYQSQIAWSVDGSLWSVEGTHLTRMTPDGRFTAFSDVATRAADVIARPDGSMWFSDPPGHRIRTITSDGTVRDIDARLPSDAEPKRMAATADGSVWFSDEKPDGGLGRLRPDGTVTRMFHGQDRFIWDIASWHSRRPVVHHGPGPQPRRRSRNRERDAWRESRFLPTTPILIALRHRGRPRRESVVCKRRRRRLRPRAAWTGRKADVLLRPSDRRRI